QFLSTMTHLLLAATLIGMNVNLDAEREMHDLLKGYEKKGFRGALAIYLGGKQVFWHTAGKADPDSGREFDTNTGFCSGSIVKSYTRYAIANLVIQGKVSLEDTLPKFFAQVPEDKKGIRIRHLLNFTSGFKDNFGGDYELIERDDLMKKMLESKLEFEPGQDERYCNSGYSMLAAIVEKVTGEKFENYVVKTQFDPMGLKRLGYLRGGWNTSELVVGTTATGDRWGSTLDHKWMKDGPSWNLRGNGGMLGTLNEMHLWYRNVYSGAFGSQDQFKVFAPELADPERLKKSVIMEAGGNNVFTTFVLFAPGKDLYIAAGNCDARFPLEESGREIYSVAKNFAP
ncbi:MAG: serine hydrolase domain-containing protein, partial [Fimbriimonadaceae bacterium]